MIRIAIDGPGGAGKSSVAKALAKRLGIIYLDTGALYRTIGLYMLKNGIDPKDEEGVTNALSKINFDLRFESGRQIILLDGEDVGDSIRTPECSMAASDVSAIGSVRQYLLDYQKNIAKAQSVVMDGRDIGTVIIPNAEVKIFLTASPKVRAQRRFNELTAKGESVTFDTVYNEMLERDKNDSTRALAPCVAAKDAITVDNSKLDFDGTVERILRIIEKKSRKKQGTFLYRFLRPWLAPIIKFFLGVKAVGIENVPKDGGLIVCSNHIAIRDVFVIATCLKRQLRFVAKRELFKIPVLSQIITALGAIKVDRGGGDVAAIKKSIELASNGEIVSIFPQGHRYPSVDPGTTPVKNGAALITYRSKCDVLPVFIKVKDNKYGFFKKVELVIGKPIPYESLDFGEGGSDKYQEVARHIFSEIVALGGYKLSEADASKKSTDNNEESK